MSDKAWWYRNHTPLMDDTPENRMARVRKAHVTFDQLRSTLRQLYVGPKDQLYKPAETRRPPCQQDTSPCRTPPTTKIVNVAHTHNGVDIE